MTVYGCVRVSSLEQNTGRQMAAMNELRILPSNVFTDKRSGKDFNRPAYQTLVMYQSSLLDWLRIFDCLEDNHCGKDRC